MKTIIVDSNIIFAGLRSKNSMIREKLANNSCRFYAPKFLFVEIFKHKERILKNSNSSEEDILEFLSLILHYINFIDENIIPTKVFMNAYELCKDVDENDTVFVAFAIIFNCQIWTRDAELKKGLISKGFSNFADENSL